MFILAGFASSFFGKKSLPCCTADPPGCHALRFGDDVGRFECGVQCCMAASARSTPGNISLDTYV